MPYLCRDEGKGGGGMGKVLSLRIGGKEPRLWKAVENIRKGKIIKTGEGVRKKDLEQPHNSGGKRVKRGKFTRWGDNVQFNIHNHIERNMGLNIQFTNARIRCKRKKDDSEMKDFGLNVRKRRGPTVSLATMGNWGGKKVKEGQMEYTIGIHWGQGRERPNGHLKDTIFLEVKNLWRLCLY